MVLPLVIVVISIGFGYKFVLYKYNLSKSTNAKDPKLKIAYIEKVLSYKGTDYAQQELVGAIKEAARNDVFSIETIALNSNKYLEIARFNSMMVEIYQIKAYGSETYYTVNDE